MKINSLLKKGKFRFVSKKITDKNLPFDGRLSKEVKIFQFEKPLTSEEAISRMQKKGYQPANLRELLCWAEKNWDRVNPVVAIGSVWLNRNGTRHVPFLDGRDFRSLNLCYYGKIWFKKCRLDGVKIVKKSKPRSDKPKNMKPAH